MKQKLFSISVCITIVIVSITMLNACSSNVEHLENAQKACLKSNVSHSDYVNMVSTITKRMTTTRSDNSVDMNEKEAKTILKPFTEDGRILHQSLLKQIDLTNPEYGLSAEDIKQIKNSGDDVLAAFSFIMYEMGQQSIASRSISGSKVVSCLGAATGISSIAEIANISGLVSAKTALQLLKVLGKRYLGYIGLAIAVYSFVDCIS